MTRARTYLRIGGLLLLLVPVLSISIRAAEPPGSSLRAGAAASVITPPLGEPIVGGFTPFPAEHIHDELHARCLVLDDGKTKIALVVCDLLGIHRTLMERSSMPHIGGVVRTMQNWIGGSSYNPCSAVFVPPPPDTVDALLHDLLDYVNGDDHPALVQAAIAHAQFETIHPFADGNGRTGRALIHVILRRRGLAPRFVPPISLVLATWASDYIAGLTTFRHIGAPASPERSAGAGTWLRTFATAAHRSCADAESYAGRIQALNARWRAQLGRVRANSAVELLLDLLPGVPVITVDSAARLIGRSEMRTGEAINRLEAAGVLRQRNIGRQRYRVFEAADVVDLFTGLERALASPAGNTATAAPTRRVPRRASSADNA